MSEIKLCECGCGQPAPISKYTARKHNRVEGQPLRFIRGHNGRRGTLLERFWSKVDTSGGPDACWPWVGGKQSNGYGSLTFQYQTYGAHRVAWELTHGPIPPGKLLCHRCDNPPCCHAECAIPGCEHLKDSPGCQSHLFLGTARENAEDRDAKGRHYARRGQEAGHAKLTDADARAIRQRYDAGECGRRLAAEFHVAPATVSNIGRRKNWNHI